MKTNHRSRLLGLRGLIAFAAATIVMLTAIPIAWQRAGAWMHLRPWQGITNNGLRHLDAAIQAYHEANGALPASLRELTSSTDRLPRPNGESVPRDQRHGPRFHSSDRSIYSVTSSGHMPPPLNGELFPMDPWHRPYIYATDGNTYSVTSYGRDGRPGGRGPDCDLSISAQHPPEAFPTLYQLMIR